LLELQSTDCKPQLEATYNKVVLRVPKTILEELRLLSRDARPLEIVGMLGGATLNDISVLVQLENSATEPQRRFEASPSSLVRGLKQLRESRLELCALFHSHPNGPALPSRTDLENARWEQPMLIVDAESGEIRAWNLETGEEVRLEGI
jgi:proteasome lid subunit RPN8/RPN11